MDIYSIQLKYVARFVLTSLLLLRPRSPFSKSAFTAHIVVSSTAAATAIRVYVGKVGCNPTWVTVTMSIQSGGRHQLGSLWVAFFGRRVWVLGIGLQTDWRSWVAQCTSEGGHRMWVVGTRVGCQCTQGRCQWHPMRHLYSGHFLSFPLMRLHPPRVTATQV